MVIVEAVIAELRGSEVTVVSSCWFVVVTCRSRRSIRY